MKVMNRLMGIMGRMGLMEMVVCLMLATVAMGQTNRTTGQLPLTATMQGTDTLLVETGSVAGAQSTRRISVTTFESLFGGGSSGSGILTGTNAGVVFTFNAVGQLILSNSVNGNMMVWNNGQLTVNGVVVLTNANAFDAANAALNATNNLGALAFQNTVTPAMVTNASGFWAAAPGASLPPLGGGANTIVTNGEPSVGLGIVYTANIGQPMGTTPGIWTNDIGYIYYGGIKTTNVFAGPILAPQFMLPVASITASGTASAQTFLRGDASWQQVEAYGAAQNATNGYVWGVLYDPANSARNATNGYVWGVLYDPVNAAQNATNGYPWGSLYDQALAAQKATNGLGSAAFTPATAYDAANAAKNATNNLGGLAFENNTVPSQVTNSPGFWAAAPAGGLSGSVATNSFEPTNANLGLWSSFTPWAYGSLFTNSFDATNSAFNALKTATNSFQPTNAVLSAVGGLANTNQIAFTNQAWSPAQITNAAGFWAAAPAGGFANGTANNTTQTNVVIYQAPGAGSVVTTLPFGSSQAVPAWAVYANTNGGLYPLISIFQDYGSPNYDGDIESWGYEPGPTFDFTHNCGRYEGGDWDWEIQHPGSDVRTMDIHAISSPINWSLGAGIMFANHANTAGYGSFGTFNHTLYLGTRGLTALGDLTDASDANPFGFETNNMHAWLDIFPGGSAWSTGSAQVPPLALEPQNLVTKATNSLENDGTNWWASDRNGNRNQIAYTNYNWAAAQITNAAGFWAAVPAAGSTLNGTTLTNSFDATNAAWNALKTATNSFDATNAAWNMLATATNSFDPVNAAKNATNNLQAGAFSLFGVATNVAAGVNTNTLTVAGFGYAPVNGIYTNCGIVNLNGADPRMVFTNVLANGIFFWGQTNVGAVEFWIGTNVAYASFYGQTNSGANFTPTNACYGAADYAGIGTVAYGVVPPSGTNQLPIGQILLVGRTNISVSLSNNTVFFDTTVTNGGSGGTLFVNGTANNTIQTNLYLWNTTNLITFSNPYATAFGANSLAGLMYQINTGSALFPLVSFENDYGSPNYDGCVTTWGYDLTTGGVSMANAGRFFGNFWNWQQQSPGADTRTMILKSDAANVGTSGGAVTIFESHAAAGTPGHHGVYNNWALCATNGTVALGQLTDTADGDNNAIKPPAWVSIYGDGSDWANGGGAGNSQPGGTASVLPPLMVASASLAVSAVAGAYEYTGTNWYLTDDNTNRWRIAVQNTNGWFSNVTNAGILISTNGVASFATNAAAFTAGGITNTLAVNLLVEGFTGTAVVKSNSLYKLAYTLGTISSPASEILQPGEMLYGSSCACVTNRAF